MEVDYLEMLGCRKFDPMADCCAISWKTATTYMILANVAGVQEVNSLGVYLIVLISN